jgi:hypothetical protein
MAIMKFKGFVVEAEVCGQQKTVEWNGVDLRIEDVTSMGEAAAVIKALASGGNAAFAVGEIEAMVELTAKDVTPEPPPFVTATKTITMKVEDISPERVEIKEAAKVEPPKAEPSAALAPSASPSSAPAAASAASPASPSEDLAVFGRFTKLSEVVAEVRARGNEDFPKILAFCKRLADLGDICAPIDSLTGLGKLEERLKVHCAGKGVAGVPA